MYVHQFYQRNVNIKYCKHVQKKKKKIEEDQEMSVRGREGK